MTPTPDRPAVWRDGTGRPPLLMLHGTGGNEHDLMPLADLLSPQSPVLSPRGSVLEAGLPRFFKRLREGLFDERDLAERADELADYVHAQGTEHDIEPGRFVAVGFSNGANIASAMMIGRPEILAGAVLFAAMVPFRDLLIDTDLSRAWVVIANGRNDPTIDARTSTTLAGQFRDMGAQVYLMEHCGGHTIDPQQLADIAAIIAERTSGDH